MRIGDAMRSKKFFKILIFVILFLILIFVFYWFEYRPTKIRQECSWVQKYQDAISYAPAKTEEQLRAEGALMDCSTYSIDSFRDACEDINNSLIGKEIQAQPARDWYEKANTQEYEFCIRSKGINR